MKSPLSINPTLPSLILVPWLLAAACPALAETSFVLEEASIARIQSAMSEGHLSSVELTARYLNRIESYDRRGIQLKSVPLLSPDSLDAAATADTLRAKGTVLGPLHGIPMLFKDSYKVAGLTVTTGFLDWTDVKAVTDAPIVTKMRQAGAVVMGKTNMSTFAWSGGNSTSELYGKTKNPYGFFTPMGSSGGSAVAVSANFTTVAFGGETYGSLVGPACANSIVTLKPTRGLIPSVGTMNLDAFKDVIGPMTRTVEDARVVMDPAVFEEPTDAWAGLIPPLAERRPATYATPLPTTLNGIRLLVPAEGQFDGYRGEYADVKDQLEKAIGVLQGLGAEVIVGNISFFDEWAKQLYLERTNSLYDGLEAYLPFDGRLQSFYAVPFLNELGAPGSKLLSITRLYDDQAYIEDYAFAYDKGTAVSLHQPEILAGIQDSNTLAVQWGEFLAQQGADAAIYPALTISPFAEEMLNQLGLPGAVVPLNDGNTSKIPDGLLFLGLPFQDKKMLDLAGAFQKASNFRKPPSSTPPLPGETIILGKANPSASRAEVSAPAIGLSSRLRLSSRQGSSVFLDGVAVDASGLGSVEVTVNGTRIPCSLGRRWSAVIPLQEFQSLVAPDDTRVVVQVLVTDLLGNVSALRKEMTIPPAFSAKQKSIPKDRTRLPAGR